MGKPKGRVMLASEIRTGDTLMSPTVSSNSVVSHVATFNSGMFVSLANGSTVELPHTAKVRVYRRTRILNHDAPIIVHSVGA